jgi:hypothetical protein
VFAQTRKIASVIPRLLPIFALSQKIAGASPGRTFKKTKEKKFRTNKPEFLSRLNRIIDTSN